MKIESNTDLKNKILALSKKLIIILLCMPLIFTSCKKEEDITYGVNQINADSYNSGKDKLKSISQYISIVYANLFQKALPANELVEISSCIISIGDKEVANEIVLSNFMNKTGVIMPADWMMRVDQILIQAGFINDPPFNLGLPSNTFLTEQQYFDILNETGLSIEQNWQENQALDDNDPTKFIVKKPTYSDGVGMDWFLEDTYKRFFIRNITEAEREYFTNFLKTHPNVSVEMIYTAFSLSNEYQFY